MFIQKLIVLILLSTSFTRCLYSKERVGGYYENYSGYHSSGNRPPFKIAMIPSEYLTDLYYAFATMGYITASIDPSNPRLTGDFTLQPSEVHDLTEGYPQARQLKQNSKIGLKLFLTLGGWNYNNPLDPHGSKTYKLFSTMISNHSYREQFINSAKEFLVKNGFDGLDIDWEYPGDLTRGGTEADFDNFVTFLRECSLAFSTTIPKLELSMAASPYVPYGLPARYKDQPSKYYKWLATCSEHLDRLNIMAYEYHGPFDIPKITGVNAPLNRDTEINSPLYIKKSLEELISNGVPAQKMILVVPLFGHTYAKVEGLTLESSGPGKPFQESGEAGPTTKQKGFLAYYEIGDLITSNELKFGADTVTSTVYAFNIEKKLWVSFDNPNTLQLKANLAKEKGLLGVSVWAINLDEYQWEPRFPNLKALNTFQTP